MGICLICLLVKVINFSQRFNKIVNYFLPVFASPETRWSGSQLSPQLLFSLPDLTASPGLDSCSLFSFSFIDLDCKMLETEVIQKPGKQTPRFLTSNCV